MQRVHSLKLPQRTADVFAFGGRDVLEVPKGVSCKFGLVHYLVVTHLVAVLVAKFSDICEVYKFDFEV